MKRNTLFICIVPFLMVCFILFPLTAWSQSRSATTNATRATDIAQDPAPATTVPSKKAGNIRLLPDLIVSDIQLDKDCHILITIKNSGPGGVPDSGYHSKTGAAIQVYKGSKAWGGMRLAAFDPAGNLKNPGGSVTKAWFPDAANLDLGPGTHTIKVVVDNNTAVAEKNEGNNTRVQGLSCGKKMASGSTSRTAEQKAVSLKPVRPKAVVPAPKPPPPPWPDDGGPPQAQSIMMESVMQDVPAQLNDPNFVDLAITNISLSIPKPRFEKMFTITITIQNVGMGNQIEGGPAAYFQMELSDDPYMNYHRNIVAPFSMALPLLTAGEVHTISETITMPRVVQNVPVEPGLYKLLATINTSALQVGDEHNSQNNQATKQFELRDPEPADLTVTNLSLTSDCRLKVTLKNKAAAIDQEDFALAKLRAEKGPTIYNQVDLTTADPLGILKTAGYFWMPQIQGNYTWPNNQPSPSWSIGLDPGETATYTVSVDPYRSIPDGNLTNNTRTETLTCPQ